MKTKKMKRCNFGKLKEKVDTHKIGSSSFKMHNSKKVIELLNLKKNQIVLDLGCGPGDYSIEISKIVGNFGQVFAIDKDSFVIDYLNSRIKEKNIKNIKTYNLDLKENIPIKENSVDICLIFTVLHILNIKENNQFFSKIKKLLKSKGKIITIDVKKEDFTFGPPTSMKLSKQEIKNIIFKHGFVYKKSFDLGYNNLIIFEKL